MTQVKLKPLADKVLIKPDPAKDETTHGFILGDGKKPNTGHIVSVGTGLNGKPLDVHEGQQVMYMLAGAMDISIENEKYVMVRQSEIIGIIK